MMIKIQAIVMLWKVQQRFRLLHQTIRHKYWDYNNIFHFALCFNTARPSSFHFSGLKQNDIIFALIISLRTDSINFYLL